MGPQKIESVIVAGISIAAGLAMAEAGAVVGGIYGGIVGAAFAAPEIWNATTWQGKAAAVATTLASAGIGAAAGIYGGGVAAGVLTYFTLSNTVMPLVTNAATWGVANRTPRPEVPNARHIPKSFNER